MIISRMSVRAGKNCVQTAVTVKKGIRFKLLKTTWMLSVLFNSASALTAENRSKDYRLTITVKQNVIWLKWSALNATWLTPEEPLEAALMTVSLFSSQPTSNSQKEVLARKGSHLAQADLGVATIDQELMTIITINRIKNRAKQTWF